MNQKMTWEEVKRTYPDEWVALVDYDSNCESDIEGRVVVHHSQRKTFYTLAKEIFPQYRDMAIRFTGQLRINPDIPLLWQIFDTEEKNA